MSDQVLDHPLVKSYLRALDTACATLAARLTPAQARELHDQLAAHLDEALPSGTSDAQVRAELERLGLPWSLAVEAAAPAPLPLLRRMGHRLRRVRWWTWAAIAVIVPALGTGAGYLISAGTAAPLVASGVIGWLYPADQAAAVETTAGDVTQTAVPYRFGQDQGILVTLVNPSDWTQRITGVGPQWTFGSLPGQTQVSVQSGPNLNVVGDPGSGSSYYASPGVIPPHSARLVRVFWTSDECLGAGGGIGISQITVEVRVGVLTRTEEIPLQQAFELTGPKHSITSC
jgi:hypothetical protein